MHKAVKRVVNTCFLLPLWQTQCLLFMVKKPPTNKKYIYSLQNIKYYSLWFMTVCFASAHFHRFILSSYYAYPLGFVWARFVCREEILNPTVFTDCSCALCSRFLSHWIKSQSLCWTQLSVPRPLSTEGLNCKAFGRDGHSRHTGVLKTHGLRYRARLWIVIHALVIQRSNPLCWLKGGEQTAFALRVNHLLPWPVAEPVWFCITYRCWCCTWISVCCGLDSLKVRQQIWSIAMNCSILLYSPGACSFHS